jgi:hypothetical protein
MRRIVTALIASAALALAAGASATPASAQDLIEYALMADLPAATAAQADTDGGFSRAAAGTTVELTDFRIDPMFVDYSGESMRLGADIDFWVDDAKGRRDRQLDARPLPGGD